jgi:hypothetical protein
MTECGNPNKCNNECNNEKCECGGEDCRCSESFEEQLEKETNICAQAFLAFLEANNLPAPGSPDYVGEIIEVINFYSFIFSRGFSVGIMVGRTTPDPRKESPIIT